MSYTNTSQRPLVSPGTRFVAPDANAMWRPFVLIVAIWLLPLAEPPKVGRLRSHVQPLMRSRRNTSSYPLVSLYSPCARYGFRVLMTTYRPSPLIAPCQTSTFSVGTFPH